MYVSSSSVVSGVVFPIRFLTVNDLLNMLCPWLCSTQETEWGEEKKKRKK